jgi:hypothetical protein
VFSEAPVSGPNAMAARPTAAAMASAAGAPTARVSVATLMMTSINSAVRTTSRRSARPAAMLGTVAPESAGAPGHTTRSSRAASVAPANWAAQ